MVEKDSFDHVVKTTAQWEAQSFEYWIIPRGVLCVELTPDKKTKIKIGEGNKIYSQLPYINSETDLSDYYTKEEIDNILAMLNFVAIPSSEIYPTKEALPQTGNRQGDLRFVLNTTGDPYEYLWFDNKWIALGGDLSEYAKKSEVNPRLNALELKAHTHVNKNVLDRLTANVIDDSHKHTNKNILDATTASYTTQDKATLDELAAITIFEGATKTEDGTMGYVPAPLQGQHTYFLKGDGTWAYLDPGDKYKAGEGIYILSGEVTTQTFPFKLYAKGGYVKQYIIYGAPGGVGEWNATTQTYHIPIRVSAEGHTSIDTTIQVRDKLYEGDWINFETQEYSVYRTNLTSQFQNLIAINEMSGIDTAGNFNKPPGYWPQFALSDYYEIDPDAKYEIPELDDWSYPYANVNMYDANKNRTRTILRSRTSKVQIVPLLGEKYLRIAWWVDINFSTNLHTFRDPVIYQLKDTISPVPSPLQQIQLIPNAINTIDVLTTTKPLDVYMETYIPEEPDPEDPLSGYSGIIYNDGVLDITQEDPNALNELTVHFRENVEKTLTIPTYELPVASDTTLGGIKVGDNLTIDPVTGVLDATGGNSYVEGQGIEFGRTILETYQVLDKIRKPSGTTLTTDVMPSGTVDFFCDLKYYKYAGDSFLILCYDGERGSFCYTPAPTASGGWARMWIYTAHQNWYDLYLNGSFASSSPIVAHLRWGNTMSMSFDHTSTSAQNTPGVLPGHNRFKFDSNSDADLYWAKFYENSALVGELIPVIRQSDNVVGLFNTVTETFSTASGLTPGSPTGETIVIYDPSSTQNIPINAKLGNGLDFDSNDAIEVVPATASTIGGIIVGDGLSVDNTGEISVDEMTGADGTNAGTAGIVPAPGAADNTKFLRGDGTWVEVGGGGGSDYVEGNGIEFIPSSITPTGYQTIEYIQSTGTQGIILNYTPSSQNVKIELKFSDINNSASGWHYMYGGWDTDSIRPPSVAYQQNGSNLVVAISNELAIQDGEYPSTSGVHTSTLITLNGNYVSLQLDAGTISSSSFGGSIYRPMALFAQTNSSGTTVAEFGSYKFHEMEIYENDVLIHHYYPCYRLSDDEIGIYDIIENVFLTNSGTGTFIRSNTPVYIDGPDSINAKLGNGLRFDSNGAIETIAATEYAAGDGIQIDEGTSVIDITNIQWQQGKIDDSDGSEAITGVEPYLDCEMFEITSHTSMVTLSGTYDNNIMLLWKPYYYDENENYISTVNTWSTYEDGVQIPINAKYVRFVLTKDETATLDPNDLAHVEIEYPLEVGKEVITNTGVIDIQVRDRKLIITKHNSIEEIPIPDPPLATTSTPGIVTVGQDLTIDQNGVLNIADINRMILNVEE